MNTFVDFAGGQSTFAGANRTVAFAARLRRERVNRDAARSLLEMLGEDFLFDILRGHGLEEELIEERVGISTASGETRSRALAFMVAEDRWLRWVAIEQNGHTVGAGTVDTAESQLVLVLHGIRTYATWAATAKRVLERDAIGRKVANRTILVHKYGKFSIIWFLSPFFPGFLTAFFMAREVRRELAKLQSAQLLAVAHSFGSHVLRVSLQWFMRRQNLERAIVCGSVLKRSQAAWSTLSRKCGAVRNHHSMNDCWPLLAEKTSFWYGASGTLGSDCRDGNVVNVEWQSGDHSNYLTPESVYEHWHPFLFEGDDCHLPIEEEVQRTRLCRILECIPGPLSRLVLLCAYVAGVLVASWFLLRRVVV